MDRTRYNKTHSLRERVQAGDPQAIKLATKHLGIDAVEMAKYARLLDMKLSDEAERFVAKIFPEIDHFGSAEKQSWLQHHEIIAVVADQKMGLDGKQLITFCVAANENKDLNTARIRRALRIAVKFVPNPDKNSRDRILLQVESQEVPFPENIKIK